MSETPTRPWIIANMGGKIISAHCDCMAGLGESCSHVGALLFYVEAVVKIRDNKTVTQDKAYWMLPAACKEVPYQEIANIDFTSPGTLRKKFDQKVVEKENKNPQGQPKHCKANFASDEKVSEFYKSLSLCKSKPAVLSIIPPYDEKYVPQTLTEEYPKILTGFYDPVKASTMNYLELCNFGSSLDINVSLQQQSNVEKLTRAQANSKKWFDYRSGQITASKVFSVVHTHDDMPSRSLIMNICYPESYKYETPAMAWGCTHEEEAYNYYKSIMVQHHSDLQLSNSGLIISTEFPFIGASPDGLVSCSCCGKGSVEIKCPFNHRDNYIFEAVEQDKNFYLTKTGNEIKLSKTHQYYYQIQTQLHVSKSNFCDFFVWTRKDYHIERIFPDEDLWSKVVSKCSYFFNMALMPELIGKFFSREQYIQISENAVSETVCYCRGKESGELFPCFNKQCKYGKFHLSCLKLKNKPRKKWLCPDCRQPQILLEEVPISKITDKLDLAIPIIIE